MRQAFRLVIPILCPMLIGCATSGPPPGSAGGAGAAGGEAAGREQAAGGEAEAHTHEMMQALPATAGPGYTVADVRFMQDMIGHHAQAVLMAGMVPTRGAGESLQRLAQKIDISQRDEIAMMKRWLDERGQAVPSDQHALMMRMPGMLTPEQLARLEAAGGREFERLFLSFMIRHHEGALQMVESLFASPGAGQDSEIFRFATDVDADQRDEIFVMQVMLDSLDTNRERRP